MTRTIFSPQYENESTLIFLRHFLSFLSQIGSSKSRLWLLQQMLSSASIHMSLRRLCRRFHPPPCSGISQKYYIPGIFPPTPRIILLFSICKKGIPGCVCTLHPEKEGPRGQPACFLLYGAWNRLYGKQWEVCAKTDPPLK